MRARKTKQNKRTAHGKRSAVKNEAQAGSSDRRAPRKQRDDGKGKEQREMLCDVEMNQHQHVVMMMNATGHQPSVYRPSRIPPPIPVLISFSRSSCCSFVSLSLSLSLSLFLSLFVSSFSSRWSPVSGRFFFSRRCDPFPKLGKDRFNSVHPFSPWFFPFFLRFNGPIELVNAVKTRLNSPPTDRVSSSSWVVWIVFLCAFTSFLWFSWIFHDVTSVFSGFRSVRSQVESMGNRLVQSPFSSHLLPIASFVLYSFSSNSF